MPRDKKPKAKPQPTAEDGSTPVAPSNEKLRDLHTNGYGGYIYGCVLKSVFGEASKSDPMLYSMLTMESLKPRDPLEEMLIIQALWHHARLAELTVNAPAQKNPEWFKLYHEAADRCANTFRRLMLTLAEYRRPHRGDNFTVVHAGQANLANQQVVNQPISKGTSSNEQGANDGNRSADPSEPGQPKALEGTLAGGIGAPPLERPEPAAVAAKHRAEDAGG